MTVNDKAFQSSQLIEMEQSEPIPLESPSTLTAFAAQLEAAGDFAETEFYYLNALENTEITLGPVLVETANSLSRIAILLRATGQDTAAEPLYRRACDFLSDALTCRLTGIRKYH